MMWRMDGYMDESSMPRELRGGQQIKKDEVNQSREKGGKKENDIIIRDKEFKYTLCDKCLLKRRNTYILLSPAFGQVNNTG